MLLRRARGIVLRLVRRRLAAALCGAALLAPAAWLEFGSRYGAWWVDGVALVAGATGASLLWTAITGARPDWIE